MNTWRAWTVAGIAGAAIACGAFGVGFHTGRRPPSAREDASPVVAEFRGGNVTLAEVNQRLKAQGSFLTARLSPLEARRDIARALVREKLLIREAERRGHANDAEVLEQRNRALIAVLFQREIDEPQSARVVTEEDLKSYFEAHRAELAHPERVRIAELFLAAPAATATAREQKRKEAEQLLTQALSGIAKDYYAFASLVRQRSDDSLTRSSGGELPWMTREELAARTGPAVADAAFSVKTTRALSPNVIEADAGFYLIQLLAHEAAVEPSWTSVKDALSRRIVAQRLQDARTRLLDEVEKDAQLRIDDAALR